MAGGTFGPLGRDDAAVRVSDDGMTLLISLNLRGPLTGPCRRVFRTGAVETRGAVAFLAEPRQVDPNADCAEPSWLNPGSPGLAEIRLTRPLGDRVVVRGADGSWFPYPVIRCGGQTWVHTPLCEEPPGTVFSPTAAIEPATLQAWADFPAAAEPRPLLLSSDVETPDFLGRADERAYATGRWDLPARLPSAPARADGYPVMTAQDALAALRGGRELSARPGSRVRVTGMRLGRSAFSTDRGLRSLPAWIVTFRGSRSTGTAVVAAVAEPGRFRYPAEHRHPGIEFVRLARDGRTLTVRFGGARSVGGSCDREFELARAESEQAVALEIVPVRRAPGVDSDPTTRCTNVGGSRHSFTLRLAAPLGGRVVVADVDGRPIPLLEPGYRPAYTGSDPRGGRGRGR